MIFSCRHQTQENVRLKKKKGHIGMLTGKHGKNVTGIIYENENKRYFMFISNIKIQRCVENPVCEHYPNWFVWISICMCQTIFCFFMFLSLCDSYSICEKKTYCFNLFDWSNTTNIKHGLHLILLIILLCVRIHWWS